MASKELRELRHKYKAAYTSYMRCVTTLSDASEKGECPTAEILRREERALSELTSSRQALLDALNRYSAKKSASPAA